MPPLSVLIKPASSSCNLGCKYCFYLDVASNRKIANYGLMTEQTHENLVKKAFEYADSQISFAFQGGEPMLAGLGFFNRHVFLCKKYNKNNIQVFNTIQTNGTLIDAEWCKFFYDNNFLVGVSLDGPKDIHDGFRLFKSNEGTFDTVFKSILLLKKYQVEYNVLCVVTDEVAKKANKIMDFFIKNGIKYLQFIACIDDFNTQKTVGCLDAQLYGRFLVSVFKYYYQAYKKMNYISMRDFDNYVSILSGNGAESCAMRGRCGEYYVVEGDGSVYPCDFYVLDEYRIGNVNSENFLELHNSGKRVEFETPSHKINEECVNCKWFSLCRGGCRRNREPIINGTPSLNKFCKSYKYFFEKCYKSLIEIANDIKED